MNAKKENRIKEILKTISEMPYDQGYYCFFYISEIFGRGYKYLKMPIEQFKIDEDESLDTYFNEMFDLLASDDYPRAYEESQNMANVFFSKHGK